MNRRLTLALALFLVGGSLLSSTEPQELVYVTEDYPPENFVENGVLKGYAVDILKAMWKYLKVPEQPIQVLPWARGYALAERQRNVVLFAMGRTPEREALFRWVGPIYHADIALMALSSNPLRLASLEQAKQRKIGVLNGDMGDELLKEARFPEASLIRVNTLEQLLKLLKIGRVDLICTTEPSVRKEIAANPSLKVDYRVALVADELQVYYGVSKATDPLVVAKLQKALTAINTERLAIIRRYNLLE